ncbi:kynureninase [Salegentibacter sp. F188]|uniref:Kynureninase n=1 Tax=Autumnicola patrickiae TaxID=3075591 RepID=A0ABU3E0C5_9FLAO|nr:kynureninase [Salegentibacter sp. F188]MDT0689439.1 kynureninase [Salegentibacter sp. F188]
MQFENTREFALRLDAEDNLAKYRKEFIFPELDGEEVVYFVGNSLGLQPRSAKKYVDEIMQDWADLAVEGHFKAEKSWWDYHERFSEKLAKVVGAKPSEVTVMNTLTVNLHLLMVSFYRPSGKRYKIICEEKAFPSDQYMLASQVRFHGYDPSEAIVEIKKRDGENNFRTEDILQKIEEVGEECALILIGGVNYYSGQVFDMQKITKAGHDIGAFVGWDLAHAAGNVELKLNEWKVDFAAWCSYKYMNSGPGNASGCYINEKYHNLKDLPRFEGWWGHNKERRFLMEPEFQPEPDANAWQISNAPVLALAPYLASLEMFDEVGMPALIKKRNKIVAYLEFVLQEIDKEVESSFEIITPSDQKERGTQISVFLHGEGKDIFNYLMKNGIFLDWREPNVIRLAPAPFYCSFLDVFTFGQVLKQGILSKKR